MPRGYCTVDDVRRALREADLPGDAAQDRDILIDAITAQSEWLEKQTKRHWYAPGGVTDDTDDLIPASTRTRSDEEDIPTPVAAAVDGPIAPRIAHEVGDRRYSRIRLARRHADTLARLEVLDDTGYTDWVQDSDYSEGRGEDYYLQVNNSGKSELYLDVTNVYDEEEDEWLLDQWTNAVYLEFSYGDDEFPQTVRRAVAFRAASDFVEDAAIQIPNNAEVYGAESLAEQLERKAEELLEVYL